MALPRRARKVEDPFWSRALATSCGLAQIRASRSAHRRLSKRGYRRMYGSRHWVGWVERLPENHWHAYRRVLEHGLACGVPFALGGALTTAIHTGQWRGTNDMDLYVQPERCREWIALLNELGLKDIQSGCPYDPAVTYRASGGDEIVELIWGLKNRRGEVDELWIKRAEEMDVAGMRLRVTAPEEMIWPKMYVVSRQRCDWPDVLNLLDSCGAALDWRHLLDRLGSDAPLLTGVLCVLAWLRPDSPRELPQWLLEELGLKPPPEQATQECLRRRASLLNPRDWFGDLPELSTEVSEVNPEVNPKVNKETNK